MNEKIIGASMFSSSGIGEYYFSEISIDIKVANELIPRRAELYSYFYPESKVIVGDIKEKIVEFQEELNKIKPTFLIATPPCQGLSTLGKKEYDKDERNYLIFYVMKVIADNDFDFIFIENVPKFIKMFFPYQGEFNTLEEILVDKFSDKYKIEVSVMNAKEYGVPQSRPRAIIKLYKKHLNWPNPKKMSEITLKEAIGDLPSLESGEDSGIKWHFSKKHNDREILAMKNTSEGNSAMKNDYYYPKKVNGDRIKGFHNTYKRMKWDQPCPARAMNNGNMGGHNNVHPGHKMENGEWSDARVLSLRELFIVSSLPADLELPDWCSDTLIRTSIGESIPPLFSKRIIEGIHERKRHENNKK